MSSDPDDGLISPVDASAAAELVLLLAPSESHGERKACLRLSTGNPPPETAMVWVTFIEGADERLEGWLAEVGELPAASAVVAVGGADRGISVTDPQNVRVERVRDATDLTRLGITISAVLEELDPELRPVLCFHSVTALLQYADVKRVFRFLRVLNDRLKSRNAAGHYHLDPETTDEQTLETIKQLFDTVIEIDADGGYHVR